MVYPEKFDVSVKVIFNLVKRSKVPQGFTGQMQIERTHCPLFHCQNLELHKQKNPCVRC